MTLVIILFLGVEDLKEDHIIWIKTGCKYSLAVIKKLDKKHVRCKYINYRNPPHGCKISKSRIIPYYNDDINKDIKVNTHIYTDFLKLM